MNNQEIIQMVEQICFPFFKFNMDFHCDRGYSIDTDVEELHTLFFKFRSVGRLVISKSKRQEYVDKIKELDIGYVEIVNVQSFGTYIVIQNIKYTNEYILK